MGRWGCCISSRKPFPLSITMNSICFRCLALGMQMSWPAQQSWLSEARTLKAMVDFRHQYLRRLSFWDLGSGPQFPRSRHEPSLTQSPRPSCLMMYPTHTLDPSGLSFTVPAYDLLQCEIRHNGAVSVAAEGGICEARWNQMAWIQVVFTT